MKTEKLLTEKTIYRKLHALSILKRDEEVRHKVELEEMEKDRKRIQERCPHTKTHIEYGQYLPCVKVCDICGGEVKD